MPIEVELRHPDLVRLHQLWLQKSLPGQLPSRSMLDPAELKCMLGYIMLLDVVDRVRFRVRLHGSRLVDAMRYNHTGGCIDEWPFQPTKTLLVQQCRQVTTAARPVVFPAEEVLGAGKGLWEVLWLPLAADGSNVDMLMCGMRQE